jgi:hypothetical protein
MVFLNILLITPMYRLTLAKPISVGLTVHRLGNMRFGFRTDALKFKRQYSSILQ